MTELSAPEALVLMSLPQFDTFKAVKFGLLDLWARGVLTVEQGESKFLRRGTIYLRIADTTPTLSTVAESLVGVVRAASSAGGAMKDVVKCAFKEYGARMPGFVDRFVNPALATRGLAEARQEKVLGMIGLTRYYRTPAGDSERSRLESMLRDARNVPHPVGRDRALATALIATGLDLSCFDAVAGRFEAFDASFEADSDLG